MSIATSQSYLRIAIGAALLALVGPGCMMEPAYLGYEVDLEEEEPEVQDTSGVQDSGTTQEELPQEPEFDLSKRECRRLGRRFYSECREDCRDGDRQCKERCEREARDFMRKCLKVAKEGGPFEDAGLFPNASVFDKSKDGLKGGGDLDA